MVENMPLNFKLLSVEKEVTDSDESKEFGSAVGVPDLGGRKGVVW